MSNALTIPGVSRKVAERIGQHITLHRGRVGAGERRTNLGRSNLAADSQNALKEIEHATFLLHHRLSVLYRWPFCFGG